MRNASWPERFLSLAAILFSALVLLAVVVGWDWLDALGWSLVVFSGVAATVWVIWLFRRERPSWNGGRQL